MEAQSLFHMYMFIYCYVTEEMSQSVKNIFNFLFFLRP